MTYNTIFANAARLREKGNSFILAELKKAGINSLVPSHGDILAYLLKHQSCNMSELARQVRRSKSTLTVLVEKLEKHGYVKRLADQRDSRNILVTLTEKGRNLQQIFDNISQGLAQLVCRNLTQQEIELLDKLLAKSIAE